MHKHNATADATNCQKDVTAYKWFVEPFGRFCASAYAVERSVAYIKSRYQEIEILETPAFGRVLVVDGRIQVSEQDELIYHEALVHPGMLNVDRLESALIIGGGPGATLREVLRYRSVKRVVMVDVDQELVEACRRYLPLLNMGAFIDERAEIRFEDAHEYLNRSEERFDAIVVDLTGPRDDGASEHLWTKEFYSLASKRLKECGVLTSHSGPLLHSEESWPVSVTLYLKTCFSSVTVLQVHVPCFGLANPWTFMFASQRKMRLTTAEAFDAEIAQRLGHVQYLDGSTYIQAMTLPKPLRACLSQEPRG